MLYAVKLVCLIDAYDAPALNLAAPAILLSQKKIPKHKLFSRRI
jgi:hypothetical protein